MTFYHINVTHHVHTCPAQDEPHPWTTEREIVDVIDGGICQTPKALYLADQMMAIPCGSYLPIDRRCPACKPIIIERSVTTIHTQPTGPVKA